MKGSFLPVLSDEAIIKQKSILENFLRNIKELQEKQQLHISFGSECNKLREKGFTVIPTSQKKPQSKYESETDKETANKKAISNEAAMVIPGWLKIIDIDNPEAFFEGIENIATVRTGRGYHIYVFDPENEIPSCKNKDFEILGGENDLAMLAGSRLWHEKLQKNVVYEVVNPRIYFKNELPFVAVHNNNGNGKKTEEETDNEEPEIKGKINLERLYEVIKPFYTNGQRQNIAMYLAGLLAKAGITVDEATDFIYALAREHNDPEIEQRIAATKHTYRDYEAGKPIKGISGLVEFGIPEEEIRRCFEVENRFFIKGNILYFFQKTKKETTTISVGPALKFLYMLYNLEEKRRQLLVQFDQFEYSDIEFSKEYLEKITKIPIQNYSLLKEYIFEEIKKIEEEKRYKYIISRTGWFDKTSDIFCIPNILKHDNIFVEHPEEKRFIINQPEKQHRLIRYSLEHATELGLLYICSISSIFLRDLNVRGFGVFISGPAGVGKTTSCKLACNVFYDCKQEIDLNATKVAKERILYSFMDLPFLLNEAALQKDEFVQELLFMLESGQTKKRSNLKLTYHFSMIRNVLFLTSERELKTDRLGAERRKLQLTISEKQPLISDLAECQKWIGAGIDYIKFYVENKNRLLSQKENIEKECTQYYQLPILFSLYFLEEFYKQKFTSIKERILKWFEEQVNIEDYFQYCIEKLENFISSNLSCFYAPAINYRKIKVGEMITKEPVIPQKFFGFIDITEEVIHIKLTTESFVKFLSEYNIDRQSFLQSMEKNNSIISNEDRKTYKIRKESLPIPVPNTRFFYFILPNNAKLEIEEPEIEEPF